MLTSLLLAAALATAPADDAASRDGLLVEAAAVPARGTVRFAAGGGTELPKEGGASEVQGFTSVLWSMGGSFAAGVEASSEGGKLSPAVSLRYQVLSQDTAFVNGLALVRLKSVGFREDDTELEAEAVLGRTFGHLGLTLAGVVGRGFGPAKAVDLEAKAAIGWSFGEAFLLGAEARYRAEVRSEAEAVPPAGREYDLIAGPALAWRIDRVELRAIGGWGVPRGTAAPGPMGMALLGFDL